jgi:ABC-2 type transport system ATP-binding protein
MKQGAITVSGVYKNFLLPHENNRTLKSKLVSILKTGSNKHEERQHALQNVSFSVQSGEFFGIVGRNGSGKSTMLKILAGIYQPTKGKVDINGKLVPFIELGVGFNPELTGKENVYLNGALLGFSTKQIDAMYAKIVEFAELERFMDQKLKNYSSGMQVRLAFSVAINSDADILLIDEVLAVGDADFQRKCFEYFKSLKKLKKTVIFVSHDMGAVREYCDRAVLINESHLVAEGSAEDIAEQYIRLFNDEDDVEQSKTQARWGDNTIVIEKVTTNKQHYSVSDHEISVTMNIRATYDVTAPVVGFSIKNSADNALLGTNTRIKRNPIGNLKAGEQRLITWTLPNILADGKHFVNATIEHEDGITVCDWWNDAAVFRVHKTERTAYHITPPVEVAVQVING